MRTKAGGKVIKLMKEEEPVKVMKAVKTAKRVKVEKVEIKVAEFRVWCEQCCIRIAPHEERIALSGKSYHPRCHSRLSQLTIVQEIHL
jgi:Zn finger protein HypA/HybF involved in hydrogenase expression